MCAAHVNRAQHVSLSGVCRAASNAALEVHDATSVEEHRPDHCCPERCLGPRAAGCRAGAASQYVGFGVYLEPSPEHDVGQRERANDCQRLHLSGVGIGQSVD